jgi:hypothetical protein
VLAASRHITDCQPTNRRAVDIELDAARHFFDVLLLEASARAAITGDGTAVAGIDAGFEVFMGHRHSPQ